MWYSQGEKSMSCQGHDIFSIILNFFGQAVSAPENNSILRYLSKSDLLIKLDKPEN